MFVWPFTISVEYDWKMVAHFFAADCILPLIALGIILFFIAHLLRKDSSNLIAFGALWFFIAIAPRSSIIPSSELLADYKTYLASVGVLFILACGIIKLIAEAQLSVEKYVFSLSHRHVQTAAVLLLAIPMGSLTYKRNKVWRTPEDFWSNIIENAPGKARAYNNLGVALSEQGKIQEAIPLYKKAITMDNHYPDPHNNLAVAYSMVGKMDLAIDTLKHAIRIHPYYPEAYNNLASFYIARKDFDQAEKLLNFALQMRPYYGKAYYNLGKIYIEKGNFEKALECFRTACTKADLDTEAGYQVYANAAINLKRYDEAIFAVRRLLSFNPSSLDLQQKLAQIYLWNKNYEESIMLYQHLIKAQPNNNLFWFNLGECFLHLKNPEKALDCYTQARNLKLNIPHLPLRMIACLEQMGQLDQAKVLLNQYIKNESVPADLKNAAKASLARLEQYQTIQTSSAHFDQKAV
jgi:tetratricopeptide (TPR) repeat protein